MELFMTGDPHVLLEPLSVAGWLVKLMSAVLAFVLDSELLVNSRLGCL